MNSSRSGTFRCSFEYSQLIDFYKTGMCLVSSKCFVENGKGKSNCSCSKLSGASKKKISRTLSFLKKPEFICNKNNNKLATNGRISKRMYALELGCSNSWCSCSFIQITLGSSTLFAYFLC